MSIDTQKVSFVTVSQQEAGQRLDNYLLARLKGLPKSRLYRLLRKGEIRVNKGRVRPSYRVNGGDLLRIPPIRLESREPVPVVSNSLANLLEKAVLYEDDNLLALDKPAGLAVHGGSGVALGAIEALRQMRDEHDYLELAHRLDRDTSGCLLVAKNSSALRQLHQIFREKSIDKQYLALVAGHWPAGLTEVNAPLRKNILKSGERMVVTAADGKPSLTRFEVDRRLPGYSQVRARPVTGRTHQIRVHAAAAGFPLCGDIKYGKEEMNRVLRERGYRRLFLHAQSLSFTFGGKAIKIDCPPPADWLELLEKLEQQNRA